MPQPQLQASHGFLHQEGLTRSIHRVTCNLQSWMGAAGALPGPASLRTEVPCSAKLIPHTGHRPLPRPFPGPSSPAFRRSQEPEARIPPTIICSNAPSEFTLQGERERGQGPVSSLLHRLVPSSPPMSLTAPPPVSRTLSTPLQDHPPPPLLPTVALLMSNKDPWALRAGGVLGAAQAADADWTQSRPAPPVPTGSPLGPTAFLFPAEEGGSQ